MLTPRCTGESERGRHAHCAYEKAHASPTTPLWPPWGHASARRLPSSALPPTMSKSLQREVAAQWVRLRGLIGFDSSPPRPLGLMSFHAFMRGRGEEQLVPSQHA